MTPPRAIAAAQTVPVRGDVAANRAQHIALAHLARDAGAEVLVFPELSLTGYELDLAEALAFDEGDARLAPLSEAARETGVTLVVGAPVRVDGRLHIGAFALMPGGSRALYTKHHLAAFDASDGPPGFEAIPEPSVFAPGDRDPLVAVGDANAAIAICADTGHALHAARAAEHGASAYLAGVFTIPSDLAKMRKRCETAAKRHGFCVAFANYGGPSGGLPSAGCSALWSETGSRLAECGPTGAGIVSARAGDGGWSAAATTLARA